MASRALKALPTAVPVTVQARRDGLGRRSVVTGGMGRDEVPRGRPIKAMILHSILDPISNTGKKIVEQMPRYRSVPAQKRGLDVPDGKRTNLSRPKSVPGPRQRAPDDVFQGTGPGPSSVISIVLVVSAAGSMLSACSIRRPASLAELPPRRRRRVGRRKLLVLNATRSAPALGSCRACRDRIGESPASLSNGDLVGVRDGVGPVLVQRRGTAARTRCLCLLLSEGRPATPRVKRDPADRYRSATVASRALGLLGGGRATAVTSSGVRRQLDDQRALFGQWPDSGEQ